MTREYTDQEMLQRQAALANVHPGDNAIDGWMSLQPAHIKPNYTKLQPGGKIMKSKYGGKCCDCYGPIAIGDLIRYDGRAHHAGQNTCDYWRDLLAEAEAQAAAEPDTDFTNTPDVEAQPVRTLDVPEATPVISDGRYTIVRDNDTHLTIRIATPGKDSKFFGERIISYLYGADNDNDYTGFAFLKPGNRVAVWKRYSDNQELRNAANFLLDPEQVAEAGYAYALQSSRCYRCGHTLTVPASIHRGLGPDCAQKVGL